VHVVTTGSGVGRIEGAAIALASEHPRRHRADDRAPLGIDVLQNEFVDLEPSQARDELRRVRRTAADHCDLHSA